MLSVGSSHSYVVTKVRQYNWHSAGWAGWAWAGYFQCKNINIFQVKYTEAILSKSIRKLLWFEVTKMLIAV